MAIFYLKLLLPAMTFFQIFSSKTNSFKLHPKEAILLKKYNPKFNRNVCKFTYSFFIQYYVVKFVFLFY